MGKKECDCKCTCGANTDPYLYVIKEAGLRSDDTPRTFDIDIRRITGIERRGYVSFVPYFYLEDRYTLMEVHTTDGTYKIAYGTNELQFEAYTLLNNHWKWGKGNR